MAREDDEMAGQVQARHPPSIALAKNYSDGDVTE
jgi:hypothetical protein